MRFELSSEQRLLQSVTADFLEKNGSVATVRSLADEGRHFDRNVWRQGAELGWTAMLVPEEAGGGSASGQGLIDATIIGEQMGLHAAPGPFTVVNTVAAALAEASNADEHADLVGELVAGEKVATWACCAPGGRWNPEAGAVEARADGDGYVLNGVHDSVELGTDADVLLVLARTPEGLTQFVIPAGTAGVSVQPLESLDLVRGFARVEYTDARVPAGALVGAAGAAAPAVERQLQLALVLQCSELVGVVQRVLEFTTQWMFDRYSFGRPLASYQALKHRFADMTMWSEAAQATMAAAAEAVQERREDAAELVSIAKSYIGQRATDIIQDCVQLHGGIGVTWEHDIHLYLRRATVDRVTWGSPSDHRRRIADLLEV
ncbi:MAG TPA: acyl-CoA dehydrogenase family protein [Amycolatopsis sp.]|nr:acyl-CoA dehydrogenase family protein [Amycolatopsis sp.]